jgi:ParB family chromosome partitioning protein
MSLKMIDLHKLTPSPENVRKTVNQQSLAELKASIRAHGVLHNLIVVEKDRSPDRYEVIDGSRRLLALQELGREEDVESGKYLEVACDVRESHEYSSEVSLAANVVRDAMHPADEFEAFSALVDAGSSIESISERFGCTAKHVEQRLKLAKLDKALISAYRDGALTLECLEAFTVTDDKKEQLSVFKSLSKWQLEPKGIRRRLTDKLIRGSSSLAIFARAEYEAAGGKVQSDLFGEDVYLLDGKLLQVQAEIKLENARQEVLCEGWSWAKATLDRNWWSFTTGMTQINPLPVKIPKVLSDEKARLKKELGELCFDDDNEEARVNYNNEERRLEGLIEEVDEKIDALKQYAPAKMKAAGCVLYLDEDGKLRVSRGWMTSAAAKSTKKADKPKKSKPKSEAAAPVKIDEAIISMSLTHDLAAARSEVARYAIASKADLALEVLTFSLACECFGGVWFKAGPVNIEATAFLSTDKKSQAYLKLTELRAALDLEFLKSNDAAQAFGRFRKLSAGQKQKILAVAVGSCCSAEVANFAAGREAQNLDELIFECTDIDVASLWRPTVENYFGRLTGAQLLKISTEVLGKEWSASKEKLPKALLAKELGKAFADKKASAKVKAWLPPGMAFSGPVIQPKKSKKKGK